MRHPIAVLSTTLALGLSLSAAPLFPTQANQGDRCAKAVRLAHGEIEQDYGVNVDKVSKFDVTDRDYSAVVDRNGDRRTVAYRFDLEFDPKARDFMRSRVLMKRFAQDIANNCGDVAMVTFTTFTDIPWYEVFGVDRNIKMFRFPCNDDAARQRPIPWGVVPHCE